MKRLHYFIIIIAIIGQSCKSSSTPETKFYDKDFDWSITIPKNFDTVSAVQWAKMQNKGMDAIEKTYDQKVDNQAKTIFVFTSDKSNYFESNYQPFDTATDGSFIESCQAVNDVLYQTFATQMPGTKIDTATSVEKIDKLDFQTLKMKIAYPNNMVLNIDMFTRLFDKKQFTVNIMYVDKAKGDLMLDAWKKSTFGHK